MNSSIQYGLLLILLAGIIAYAGNYLIQKGRTEIGEKGKEDLKEHSNKLNEDTNTQIKESRGDILSKIDSTYSKTERRIKYSQEELIQLILNLKEPISNRQNDLINHFYDELLKIRKEFPANKDIDKTTKKFLSSKAIVLINSLDSENKVLVLKHLWEARFITKPTLHEKKYFQAYMCL